jgi:hypothetical protein
VKNALLLLADTSGVFENCFREELFLTGGGRNQTSPASEDILKKVVRRREAINPMPNRG